MLPKGPVATASPLDEELPLITVPPSTSLEAWPFAIQATTVERFESLPEVHLFSGSPRPPARQTAACSGKDHQMIEEEILCDASHERRTRLHLVDGFGDARGRLQIAPPQKIGVA